MGELSLSLLGEFNATLDGRSITAFRTRLAQAILIYLACRPERHRREQVMALLWPDVIRESAQGNLRQNLYTLRQTIPEVDSRSGDGPVPLILSGRDWLQLNPDAAVFTDAVRLGELLDLIQPGRADLEEAVTLYQGDFLAGFYLPQSNPFEEWAQTLRDAYRRGVLDYLEQLTRLSLGEEDLGQAEAYARQQLAIDPLHEAANRHLIEILARSGRRSAAISHFEGYQGQMQQDLQLSPGAETLSLIELVRSGDIETAERFPANVRSYDIVEEIGRSSHGVVYRALQTNIDRQVAIKVIAARYADDVDFIRRFEAEAQFLARLEHSHVVPLYDYWREPGSAYLVMRYLQGGNLKDILASGPLPLDQVIDLLDQIASALQAAHRGDIVHRDVKPGNVLLDGEGTAYLSDFGIAQLLQTGSRRPEDDLFYGTPDYLSPEQAQGLPLSPLSDQYNLGLVAYEAMTARRPFETQSLAEMIQKQIAEPLPSVHDQRPEVPSVVDEVLSRATAKKPEDRYPDVATFARAMRAAVFPASVDLTAAEPLLEVRNPYKGLLAFTEADAPLFFGREVMTQQLVRRLAETGSFYRCLAVVGPSGSGKSSLVKAGLLPALRRGDVGGSEAWFIVEMSPGSDPYAALEAALLRIAVDPPDTLAQELRADNLGLLRAARSVLPSEEGSELVLVLDQFEELFTQVDDPAMTARFVDSLCTAVNDPDSPVRVIMTLRADFYDRPLLYPGFSECLQTRTEVVIPLTAEELQQAIVQPAARVGVEVEPQLVTDLIEDVTEQPGALPMLQYALSELFDGREGDQLTAEAYEAFGGIEGALRARAESVFGQLDENGRLAARALFSRLVALGSGREVTRRRALLSELTSLDMATESALTIAIEQFGYARLLSFDHDPATRGATIEIAHEALLQAWPRLAAWIEEDRADMRLGRVLSLATTEWVRAGMDEDFLLLGARLDQLAPLAGGGIALTEEERLLLEKSLAAQQERQAAENRRREKELKTAQQLAATEQQRAEEEAASAAGLRRRAQLLAGALALAAVLAIVALGFARSSGQNAVIAATRAAEAHANADMAAASEEEAEANAALAVTREREALDNARLAGSRELSQAAYNTLDTDPELSLLLALQALERADTKEAQEALHTALQSTRVLASFDTDATGHYGAVFAISPDGARVATAGERQMTISDPSSGSVIQTLELATPSADHHFLAFSDNSQRLALVTDDKDNEGLTVQIWDLGSGETEAIHPVSVAHSGRLPVAVSPDWGLLAAGQEDGTVALWDVNSDEQILSLPGHDEAVVDVAFDDSDRFLATAGRNGLVQVWDVAASVEHGTPELAATVDAGASRAQAGGLVHLAFIGDEALALGHLGQVEIWDLNDGARPRFTLLDSAELTRDFAVSPDLRRMASAGQDGTSQVWDLATGEHLLTLAQHPSPADAVSFGPDAGQVFTLDRDGLLRVWDARPSALGESASLSVDPAVFDVALSPDGRHMALGNAGGPASVWDIATGERRHTLSGDVGGVYRVDYSPDGTRLATVGTDGKLRVWDMTTGQSLWEATGHEPGVAGGLFPGVMDVAYSPDGTRLVTAGADGVAKIWDANDGRGLMALTGHTDSLHSLAWSPDGRFIATTSDEDDTTVKLWNAETGELVHTLPGHVIRVWGLSFSPDSTLLITGGARGIIKAWDVASGENLYTVFDESDHIGTVAFLPDGQHFVTTGETPTRLRRTSDGEEVLTLAAPLLWSAEVSEDGRWLYAGDIDGMVRVFALETADAIALARERLTRWWQPNECRRYLHTEECPQSSLGLDE